MVVVDPFVGTGGLLISAHHFGAIGVGSDIDVRVLKGWGVSYINPKYLPGEEKGEGVERDDSLPAFETDIFQNFKDYSLPCPEIMRADNHARVWRLSRKSHKEGKPRPWADAIMTDPPYGIRAGAWQSGRSKESDTEWDPDPVVRSNEQRQNYIPPTVSYQGGTGGMTSDLVALAEEVLVEGGRLVFLLPVEAHCAAQTLQDLDKDVFRVKGFRLMHAGLQFLAAGMGRYLVTLVKDGSPSFA
eukprot:GHVN01049154.1.p1 GENE.GHVN01049154.1~~GHVN01049154.1.p1  ORF type:complete len:243 (-),score=22.92 GHVN01049154.1:88-816(-)